MNVEKCRKAIFEKIRVFHFFSQNRLYGFFWLLVWSWGGEGSIFAEALFCKKINPERGQMDKRGPAFRIFSKKIKKIKKFFACLFLCMFVCLLACLFCLFVCLFVWRLYGFFDSYIKVGDQKWRKVMECIFEKENVMTLGRFCFLLLSLPVQSQLRVLA